MVGENYRGTEKLDDKLKDKNPFLLLLPSFLRFFGKAVVKRDC